MIALAELTWLAIRVEMPAAGFLSFLKGFPSIFITSLAVVTVLGWAQARGRLLALQIFQNFSHNPLPMVLAHWGAFAVSFGSQLSFPRVMPSLPPGLFIGCLLGPPQG